MLYSERDIWCGRFLYAGGRDVVPARIQSLVELGSPCTVADIMGLVQAANWFRGHIPHFSAYAQPLSNFVTRPLASAKRRTKQAASRISVDDAGWDDTLTAALNRLRTAIIGAVTLAHLDPEKFCVLFTNASRQYWFIMITQIPIDDKDKPVSEMRHKPLAFGSGPFKHSQNRWHIFCKEAWSGVLATERFHDLLARPYLWVMDAKNLT